MKCESQLDYVYLRIICFSHLASQLCLKNPLHTTHLFVQHFYGSVIYLDDIHVW